MKVYEGVVAVRYYQTVRVAASGEDEAKKVMLAEFNINNATGETEVQDMKEIQLTLNANQQAFIDAYYENVDSDDEMRSIITIFFHRKDDAEFINEFGTSVYTNVIDHWNMWTAAHGYLIGAIKEAKV